MKMIIVVALALVATASSAQINPEKIVEIIESHFEKNDKGYNFRYETDDKSSRSEEGTVKEVLDEENKPQTVITVRGSYSYTNPDGKEETVNYYADETGFHAEGDSIPKIVSRR